MKALKTIATLSAAITMTACGATSSNNNRILPPVTESEIQPPQTNVEDSELNSATGQFLTTISQDKLNVQLIIDKPAVEAADVILTFHGTVETDDKIIQAAQKTLDETKKLIKRNDILYISVAYPEEGLLMGDNIKHSEAALLWVKQKASSALNIITKRVFLIGHSQGGYIVTRLNTMHPTDGVIANAPGPLDFKLRCELEESGKIPESVNCRRIRDTFGNTSENALAYAERSLLSHLKGFKSRIIFTQGMSDSSLQLKSWPLLKSKVNSCTDCAGARFEELEGQHGALFSNPKGAILINDFIK